MSPPRYSLWRSCGPMVGTGSTWFWISLAHLRDPPQALLSHLSTGLAAHLFNGWQAPECPIPWVQESTHTSPTRGPFLNPGKPLWPLFPPTATGRRMFALRVLIRYFSPIPGCSTQSPGPGAENKVGVRERTPSPSGRPSPSSRETRELARVRALPARTLPPALSLFGPALHPQRSASAGSQ